MFQPNHPSPWRDNAEIPSDVPARSSTVESCINTQEQKQSLRAILAPQITTI